MLCIQQKFLDGNADIAEEHRGREILELLQNTQDAAIVVVRIFTSQIS
jgi:hypothetical protein